MNFRNCLFICLIFIPFTLFAQNDVNNKSIDKAVEIISSNIVQKLLGFNNRGLL